MRLIRWCDGWHHPRRWRIPSPEVGDGIQLGIVSGRGRFVQGESQDRHCVDKLVFWSERRLSEVGVAELDGVQELLALGVLSDDKEGAVMMKDGPM